MSEANRQKIIKNRIKTACSLRDTTMSALSHKVGATPSNIIQWNKSRNRIPYKNLVNISIALDMPMDFFRAPTIHVIFDEDKIKKVRKPK